MDNLRNKCARALATTFGLDTSSLNSALIDNAIMQRMCACECDAALYEMRVNDSEELASLHQLLLVSESWFCREMDGVEAALIALQNRTSALSILSVPCARGEEPISVFDRALTVGFSSKLITVHGYDVSESAIKIANAFRYSTYSYRGTDEHFIERLFIDDGTGRSLKPQFRESFVFETANVLAGDWIPKLPTYDLILCRNLLIYLDPTAQRTLIEKLSSLLSFNGYLLLGAAEGSLANTAILENCRTSPVLFRRKTPPSSNQARMDGHVLNSKLSARLPVIKHRHKPSANFEPQPTQTAAPSVQAIAELAKKGQREEAYRAALEFIEEHPKDAKVHALLGALSVSFGQFAQAQHWILQAISLSQNEDEILRYLDSVECGERQ